jgi:integrase
MTDRRRRRKGEGSIKYDRANDRWRGSIRIDGVSHNVSGKTEAEVSDRLAELRVKAAKGPVARPGRLTLNEYMDRWLESRTDLGASTHRSYTSYTSNHIKPRLGAMQITQIRVSHVQTFVHGLVKAGLAIKTVYMIRTILRKALRDAERDELIDRNPAARLVDMPSIPYSEVVPLTPAEARIFIDRIRGHRREALYIVALTCGLRQGEVLGLRWRYTQGDTVYQDVDFDKGTLTVRYGLKKDRARRFVLGEPKTAGSHRTIVLPKVALAALLAHRQRQRELRMQAEHWEAWDLVFCNTDGTPILSSVLLDQFKRLLRKYGLPAVKFHDLRHTTASLLIAEGATMKEVAATLGHTKLSTTADIYSHLFAEARQQTADRMDQILGR